MREVSAQREAPQMVCGVDDGPKTDWLLAAREKDSGAVGMCWCKLGILK